jgi:class 3 adenylate cyclase
VSDEEVPRTAGSAAPDLTFLFTDLQGSTDLFRQFPDEMFVAMESHDEIVNHAIRSHGGDPFKHTGDGVVAVFDNPIGAVLAAIDIQLQMPTVQQGPVEELVLRIGLNTGQARPRAGDYFGPALATASRLEGAASGHQILISESTHRHLNAAPHDSITFTDLRSHRFKGVEPIQVFR